MPTANDLTGTWRVTGFQQWSPDGKEHHPIGKAPAGFAIFDTAGRFFFQLSKNTGDGASPEDVARSFMGYFGRFTVRGKTLSLTAESGNSPEDVGTTQARAITLDGDTLTIGIPGKFQATLRREAKS